MGVDFRSAPLEVREQLAFSQPQIAELLTHCSGHGFTEMVVLATCNRTEFYLVPGNHTGSPTAALLSVIKLWRPGPQPDYAACDRFEHRGDEAVRRLFRVAAGLESQILGDTHIQSQVRQAFDSARRAGTLGPGLALAGACALRAAKQVRRRTALSAGAASLGAATLRSIRKWRTGKAPLQVALIGSGEAARDIATHLSKSSDCQLQFLARRNEAAVDMASQYSGRARQWQEARFVLQNVDVIVAATAAQLPFLTESALAATLFVGRRVLLVDAGVPRNADPAVANLPDVTLFDIDHLEHDHARSIAQRSMQIPLAEEIVEAELRRWKRRVAWQYVEPAVKDLYSAAEQLRLSLLSETRVNTDLNRATRRLMNSLLAAPVKRLRDTVFLAAEDHGIEGAVEAVRLLTPALSHRR